jgi:hypothetical protein
MAEEPPPEAPPPPRRGKRHSQAMFVTGIVITSFAPIGLLVTSVGLLCGLTTTNRNTGCGDIIVGGLVTTGIFAGIGVPLIVIGAKREPVAIGRVAPWLTPRSAGIGLRFDL